MAHGKNSPPSVSAEMCEYTVRFQRGVQKRCMQCTGECDGTEEEERGERRENTE